MTRSELIKHLKDMKRENNITWDDHRVKLFGDDYEGDWGEGNETLGHYCGINETLIKVIKLLKEGDE